MSWLLETIVASTLLMLLVLAIRGPVRRAFGSHMAYALWLLPVLRMAMPPLPASWREQAAAPVAAAGDVIAYYVVEPIAGAADTPSAVAAASVDWLLVAALAWGAGALLFLGYHLIAHARYCRDLLRAARVDRTVAEGRVRVIETEAAHGPLAFGVFRKYVAFPRDFAERYDEQERVLALAHELGHHARGDLLANWIALVVLAIHWFNPVAWRAFRAFRADQEMACDALVLSGRAQALRHAYGRAIVKSAHGGAVSAACHLHTINEVKGRLRMLTKTGKSSPARIACGLVGVSALGLAALGLTASGSQAADAIKNRVEAVTGVSLAQEVPAPPAPPAPAAVPEGPHKVHRQVYRYTTEEGKGDKRVKKIVIVRADGEQREIEMPDIAEIEARIPQFRDGKCGGPDGKPTIEHRSEGGKQVTIICTDRIERMAREGERLGLEGQRLALRSRLAGMQGALMGLRHARAAVEGDTSLSADERAKALKGIDEAIHELENKSDKD